MIRVLVVDDQTLVRQGIRSLLELEKDVEVVGEAEDGEAALTKIAALMPDVVLLDLRMPRLDGLGVLKRLKTLSHVPPCLILTTFDDDALVFEALRAGAKGYLLKDVSLKQLVSAVKSLHRGKTLVQPAVTARVLRHLPRSNNGVAQDAIEPLTERELEVLRLMTGGFSNKEIGRALELSEGTVKNHVSSILAKIGVRDRTRAVLKAVELGLL